MRLCVSIACAAMVLCHAARAVPPELDGEEIRSALFLETVTLPSPGEFFAAADKQFQPNWAKHLRPAVPVSTHSREHLALQLGMLLADGFVAIEAQDGQASKNNGRDVIQLAEKLNVGESVVARGQNISDLSDKGDWRTLREELDAMQNDIRLSMQEQNDNDLLVFLMIGSWIRQMEIASKLLAENPSPQASTLVVQPDLLRHLLARLEGLPEKTRTTPLAQNLLPRLRDLEAGMSEDSASGPSGDKVRDLTATLSDFLDTTEEAPRKP